MLIIEISGGVWQLETVQHCLSAVMRVWSFMDCVLVTLNVSSSSSSSSSRIWFFICLFLIKYPVAHEYWPSIWKQVKGSRWFRLRVLDNVSFAVPLKKNLHRFQTFPASDLINLASVIGSIMWNVPESGDDSIFALRLIRQRDVSSSYSRHTVTFIYL